MMRVIVAGVFLLANVAGPAMADACSTAGHGSNLPATATLPTVSIASVLSPGGGVYACYNRVSFGNLGTRENNETLLTGSGPTTPITGSFQEYHNGGATVQLEGTYTITTLASGGVVEYKYVPGKTFSYYICSANSGTTSLASGSLDWDRVEAADA